MRLNYQLTKARKAIADIISDSPKPLSVQEIILKLSKNNFPINKTTVYRDLQFLSSKGIVSEVIINSRQRYYESSNKSHHHHLICNKCGQIDEITLENDLYQEEKRLELIKGFKTIHHTAEFFGLCNNCQ